MKAWEICIKEPTVLSGNEVATQRETLQLAHVFQRHYITRIKEKSNVNRHLLLQGNETASHRLNKQDSPGAPLLIPHVPPEVLL